MGDYSKKELYTEEVGELLEDIYADLRAEHQQAVKDEECGLHQQEKATRSVDRNNDHVDWS